MELRKLVGSGDKVMAVASPVLIVGLGLNLAFPSWFSLGGGSAPLFWVGAVVLALGLVLWLWSVALILAFVPKGKLITRGPFRILRHPLYVSIGLLVLPGLGLVLDSFLGLLVGAAVYLGVRLFAAREEKMLGESFGEEYARYRKAVLIPWL